MSDVPGFAHDHNRRAWDARVRRRDVFTRPASDEDFRQPLAVVDRYGWLGPSIAGRRVLCLASGGGSQSALYAAAGAKVTVVDISAEMLALDRQVATERGLDLEVIQASMDDLAALPTAGYDIVIQPVSTCYVPDVLRVYREVARVHGAQPACTSASTSSRPACKPASRPRARGYELTEPYYRTGPLPEVVGSPHREPGTLEFLHRWEELLGGLCRAGFVIEDLVEPLHADSQAELGLSPSAAVMWPPYVRIKARRVGTAGAGQGARLWTP